MPTFPGFHLVPASTWVALPQEKQDLLRNAGGFPVNDKFIPLWNRPQTFKREILMLLGTYGSSKTHDRILEHLLLAMTQPYFKCFFGRAVFDQAKSEFHSTIISVIKREGWQEFFDYSEKANGTKEIVCIATGNKFKPFGCDDEESIGKGWDDATHILVDEINQITFKQYGMLQSRLRKKGVPKALTGMFNNCDVYEDHWLFTLLCRQEALLLDEKGVAVDRNIIQHLSLYTDNYFIDHDEYRIQLIEQAGTDPERQHDILEARWGSKTTGQPFYKNFSPKLHVAFCDYNPKLALHVSFDDNVNPYLPCGIFQVDGNNAYWIDEIAASNPYNKVRWVCNEIYKRYGPSGKNHQGYVYVYGDSTSVKDDTTKEKGRNFFILVRECMSYFKPRLRIAKVNPNVADRCNFINDVFERNQYGLFITISTRCKHAIADFLHTAEAPDGNGKDKSKTTVDGIRGVQRWGHFTDLFDYFYCEVYGKQYALFRAGGKKQQWTSEKRVPHNAF